MITFSGRDFKTKFIVYFWKRENQFLYIGSSILGFKRFLAHELMKPKFIHDEDEIEILFCESAEACRRIEQQMIRNHQPILNIQHTRNNEEEVNEIKNEKHERIFMDKLKIKLGV